MWDDMSSLNTTRNTINQNKDENKHHRWGMWDDMSSLNTTRNTINQNKDENKHQ